VAALGDTDGKLTSAGGNQQSSTGGKGKGQSRAIAACVQCHACACADVPTSDCATITRLCSASQTSKNNEDGVEGMAHWTVGCRARVRRTRLPISKHAAHTRGLHLAPQASRICAEIAAMMHPGSANLKRIHSVTVTHTVRGELNLGPVVGRGSGRAREIEASAVQPITNQ
jgi:hypothetical protein